MEEQLIQAVKTRVIIEMMGSPAEHIQKTLKNYVEKLKADDTVKILKEHYAEPKKTEKGLYTTFAELEINFKDSNHLVAFCFDAMPSSVEILEPDELRIPAKEFEGLLNDLQSRLHTVDLAIKKLKATARVIDSNAVNIFRNFLLYALKSGEKTSEELSTILGTKAEQLKPFVDKLVEEKKIKKKGDKLSKI